MHNDVCCVIVTYNIGEDFLKCFNSIVDQVDKVIIVDNGSDEETISVLKSLEGGEKTEVIYNSENLGIASALNSGVKRAEELKAKWVLTMDNDSISTTNMVEAMINTYEALDYEKKNKVVSLTTVHIETGYTEISENDKESDLNDKSYKQIDVCITSGNLVKTEVFKEVNYFEEKLFIDSVDFDFCFKLKNLNYELIQINGAKLLHRCGNADEKDLLLLKTGYTNHNYIRRYYMTRNRFYLWNKYKGIESQFIKVDKRAFYTEILKVILFEQDKKRKLKMIIKGIRDYKKDVYGKISI
ncbi:glycosyltransferase [Clostridium sp. YIM B02505]|uniref:Glycosyltransferase n=1 Tax=Clostridium yunnanense TaxID=2800325 RepID=A0ABS1ELP0_9CLOT|nr:glycosyltransferase [Clostridium yunnanense]MBK1810281.1 glycosyltransferase [Clostridium yunnanense]